MAIGDLDRLVSIQYQAAGQDAAGQPNGTWTELASVWANVRYQSGVEAMKADAPASTAKVSIKIRRRTDVTAAMRVVYLSTTFQILAVLPNEEDRRSCFLVCEVVA